MKYARHKRHAARFHLDEVLSGMVEREGGMLVPGPGRGGLGSSCLTGIEVQFPRRREFQRWMHSRMTVFSAFELCT